MKNSLKRYKKKSDQYITAIQLNLETEGFRYQKWGAKQQCKQGDWIVNNNGEIYTVDKDVFARTYREEGSGRYVKSTPVWAEIAEKPGSIDTKEGQSNYNKGDYLVYNNEDGTDAYCMKSKKFESMYEPDQDPS